MKARLYSQLTGAGLICGFIHVLECKEGFLQIAREQKGIGILYLILYVEARFHTAHQLEQISTFTRVLASIPIYSIPRVPGLFRRLV